MSLFVAPFHPGGLAARRAVPDANRRCLQLAQGRRPSTPQRLFPLSEELLPCL